MIKTYPILHITGPVARLYAGGVTVGEARIDDTGIVVGLFQRQFSDKFAAIETLKERQIPVVGATVAESATELLIAAFTGEVTDEDGNHGKATFDCDGLRLTGERHEAIERWLTGLEVPVVAEYGGLAFASQVNM